MSEFDFKEYKCEVCGLECQSAYDGICWRCEHRILVNKNFLILNTLCEIYGLGLSQDVHDVYSETDQRMGFDLQIVDKPKGKIVNYPWLPIDSESGHFKVFSDFYEDVLNSYEDSGGATAYGRLEDGVWLSMNYSW